jgi:hypothetical protein
LKIWYQTFHLNERFGCLLVVQLIKVFSHIAVAFGEDYEHGESAAKRLDNYFIYASISVVKDIEISAPEGRQYNISYPPFCLRSLSI